MFCEIMALAFSTNKPSFEAFLTLNLNFLKKVGSEMCCQLAHDLPIARQDSTWCNEKNSWNEPLAVTSYDVRGHGLDTVEILHDCRGRKLERVS